MLLDRCHPGSCCNQKLLPLSTEKGEGGAYGFTLVEMLVVIGLMAVMMTLILPAVSSLKGNTDVTKAVYDIKGILDQARAYAIAKNTFVWVGLTEGDASVSSSQTPQVATGSAPYGRVAIAVLASRDGTRNYDVSSNSLGTPPFISGTQGVVTNGSTLVALSKLTYFDNMHLAAPGVLNGFGVTTNANGLVGTGGMQRPGITSNYYVLAGGAAASTNAVTQFAWPLGQSLGSGQYQFKTVINFDPQGIARIQCQTNNDAIGKYMEIGLIPTRGNSVPSTTPSNRAAIQIDCMTGATRIYRP